MALTATQLTDFQADIGISSDGGVFTDAELNRLYARAGSDYNLAVLYAIRQILVDAARFDDYSRNETSESKSQVFEHLKELYSLWASEMGGGAVPLVTGTIEQDLIEPFSTTEYT